MIQVNETFFQFCGNCALPCDQVNYAACKRKAAELAATTANTCVMPLPTFIELCESVEKSHIGTLSDRERLVVNRVRDIIGRQQHNT
jgi:hypothetical protein